MNSVSNFDVSNLNSLTFQAGKITLTTPNFNLDKVKNTYLTSGTVINAPKINLIGNSILNNSGAYKKDTYITGDIYLSNNKADNYIEALFGHLTGNVYTEDPLNYELMDVNTCNAVYMNGKNTQWKAFKTNPDRAFLYDLYSTKPLREIKKNLLDNFNKPFVKMTKTNDNCYLNVMFENDIDKDVKVTSKDSLITSLPETNDTYYLPRNTNNIETVGTLNLTDSYFTYKGNITIDNTGNTNTTPTFKIRQSKVDGDFNYIGNGIESFSGASNMEYGTITGNLTLNNLKNVTFNAWVNVGKDTVFNNVDIINLNNYTGKKDLYIYRDDPELPTFLNFYLGSNIGTDAYLNNIAFINFDNTGATVKGTIHDAREDKLKDTDFCSAVSVNGSNSGWKYFESMPNIAFNEKIFNDYNTNLPEFKKLISGNLRGQFQSTKISGKYCVTTIDKFGLDNQRNAEYLVTDNTYNLAINRIYTNTYVILKNPKFKSIDIAGTVYFNNGLDVSEYIKANALINDNSRHYIDNAAMVGDLKAKRIDVNTLSGSLTGTVEVDDINTVNMDISMSNAVNINNLNVKGDLTIRNLIWGNDANVNINNLNMILSKNSTLFNVGANISGFPQTSKVLLNVNNFTLTKNPSYTITAATKFTVNNTHDNASVIKMPNGFKLDGLPTVVVTVNNKNGASVVGDVYLNDKSYYEQDSNSKTFGHIYGGVNDYSSVGQ